MSVSGGRRWRRAATVAAAVVFAGALAAGGRAIVEDLRTAFRQAPTRILPPEIEEQARKIRSRIPPGSVVLYVGNRRPPDTWYSRLWQRALYPTRLVIAEREKSAVVLDRGEAPRATVRQLRDAFSPGFAISAGIPPEDPGFSSHEILPAVPGYPYETWFGELKP